MRRTTLLSLSALVVVAIGAIGFGVANIAPLDVLAIIGKSLFGLPVGSDISAGATSIVMEIRLPRILAAIAVGAALATSGAAFQSLLRNPLALLAPRHKPGRSPINDAQAMRHGKASPDRRGLSSASPKEKLSWGVQDSRFKVIWPWLRGKP